MLVIKRFEYNGQGKVAYTFFTDEISFCCTIQVVTSPLVCKADG